MTGVMVYELTDSLLVTRGKLWYSWSLFVYWILCCRVLI